MIWLQGNQEVGMNYSGNPLPYRQDSNFLYYTGLDAQGLHLLIDVEEDKEYLVGDDLTVEESVWVGDLPKTDTLAEAAGIENIVSGKKLPEILSKALKSGKIIHTLEPYHGYQTEAIRAFAGEGHEPSESLVRAIIGQRSVKEDREVREIENALVISDKLHRLVMRESVSGRSEQEIYAKAVEVVLRSGGQLAYNAIVTVEGQTLHINTYRNTLQEGQLLLCDMGAENAMHYASDITRTTPVNRVFNTQQRAIYEIVLDTLKRTTEMVRPGVEFKEIHLSAAKIITEGLKGLGLLTGDTEEIVEKGAHALFFPHGLGHMLGLDVHDMEGLGEKFVGYNSQTKRSEQFGTTNLRLGRILEKNFVITVEPGIYFIPQLINWWKSEKKFEEHIPYDRLDQWMNFGGVRIEDNVLVTGEGRRVLGPGIPKEIDEITGLD